jgi:enoyl-CoA hydratase/carnithine racemase
MYGMPTEIDVQADGALRIITLNRPDALNAVNDPLHCGLARLWDELSEDRCAGRGAHRRRTGLLGRR